MIRNLSSQNLNPVLPQNQEIKTSVQPIASNLSFNQILQDKLGKTKLNYSKHADFKMKSLGIVKNNDFENQLEMATNKARQKNIKEGLILADDFGFVVSVKNNTVITVVSLKDMKDKVFTNIDGAVII